MKLIPLTLYRHDDTSSVGTMVHINPEYIVGIEAEHDSYGEFISTRITFVSGVYYTVTEMPREIISEIEDEGWWDCE